jgi:hypothetical protein
VQTSEYKFHFLLTETNYKEAQRLTGHRQGRRNVLNTFSMTTEVYEFNRRRIESFEGAAPVLSISCTDHDEADLIFSFITRLSLIFFKETATRSMNVEFIDYIFCESQYSRSHRLGLHTSGDVARQ